MFLPVRFSRMSPVPLCTWWGRTDGRTAPPPAWTPPAAAGTWGGGSPPAAVGHSGSILRAPGPLHWQGGDGSARVQFPRRRTSSRAGEAGGCLKPSGWDAGGHGPVLLSGHRGRGDPRQNAAPKRSGAPPPTPRSPPRRVLHAGGAEARLGQEGGQQPGRVRVPRSVIAAKGHTRGTAAPGWAEHSGTGRAPEEGELMPVHPVLQAQRWVLPDGRHDEAEEQRKADEGSGQDDLRGRGSGLAPQPLPPSQGPPHGRTWAKKPRVLRRAWSSRLVKRARSCCRVSAQPRTHRLPPAAPRSRSVSCGSSAAKHRRVLSRLPAARSRGSAPVRGHGLLQGRPRAWVPHAETRGTPQPPNSYLCGLLGLSVRREESRVIATVAIAAPPCPPIPATALMSNLSALSRRGQDTSPVHSHPQTHSHRSFPPFPKPGGHHEVKQAQCCTASLPPAPPARTDGR